jgi:hypothetical protein
LLTEAPVADRIGYYALPTVLQPDGTVFAAHMRPIKGSFPVQQMSTFGPGWLNDWQIYWRYQKPGDELDLELKGVKAGKYKIIAGYTHAADYGIVQLSVNGNPIDTYDAGVVPGDPVELGTANLTDGANVIGLTSTGKNDKSRDYAVGVDYFKLVPAP